MWCHLSPLAVFIVPLGNVVGPLVVWLTKRHDFPLVDEEGKKALNFQISLTIYWVVLFGLAIVGATFSSGGSSLVLGLIALPLLAGLAIFWVFMVIKAAVRTNEGRAFDYPLSIRFIS